jgi:hypothetical protein
MVNYTFISKKKYDLINLQSYLNNIFLSSNITINNINYQYDDNELIFNLSSNLDSSGFYLLQNSIKNYSLSNINVINKVYKPEIIIIDRIIENSPVFKNIKSWTYPGYNIKKLDNIEFKSYLKENYLNEHLNNNNFNYSVRLLDVTNKKILGSGTYNNYIETENKFLLSNLNSTKANLELQLQKNTSAGYYIELNSLTFNYIL